MTNGRGVVALNAALTPGSYHIRADVNDLAGNTGYGAGMPFSIGTITIPTLTTVTPPPPEGIDPIHGDAELYQGTLTLSVPLDLDQSPGTDVSGNMALVYNSDRVNAQPIISAQVQTPNNVPLPSTISAQLTWNGTAQTTQNYSTTGLSAGELFQLSQQVSSPVTTTGVYPYTLQVVLNYTTPVTMTYSGSYFVDAEDSSAYLCRGEL